MTDSDQLTKCNRQKIELAKENLEKDNIIANLLKEQANQPNRDFKYYIYGLATTPSLIVLFLIFKWILR